MRKKEDLIRENTEALSCIEEMREKIEILSQELSGAKIKIMGLELKSDDVLERESNLELTELELKLQKERTIDVKELFFAVFKNPKIREEYTVNKRREEPDPDSGYGGTKYYEENTAHTTVKDFE